MDQEFITAVKELPLQERVQAIAITYHLEKWAKEDEALQKQINKLKRAHLQSVLPLQQEINAVINATRPLTQEEIKDASTYSIDATSTAPLDHFWSKVLECNPLTSKLLSDTDKQILKSLKSVEAQLGANQNDFKIRFHFASNEHFDECVLEKEYLFEDEDAEKPNDCKGTKINWKDGKNVTKRIQKKKQKNKKTGQVRDVEQEVKAPSFFHFFENLDQITDKQEQEERLDFDFQLGAAFVNEVIPQALGYYLGIKKDEDHDFDDDQDNEEESYLDSQEQE